MELTRRQVLALAAGAALLRPRPARALTVQPRDAWGADLPPTAPLAAEDDVRFLIVHHTVSPNDYAPERVPDLLRGFFRFHTGERGWPDVAYNFFVDRFGVVWEGRAGSLAGPVQGDATGGSQGFAQLCAFVGDHRSEPPAPAAVDAMTALLAELARRHGIDPTGATSFTSRGSNRWPAGSQVTTRTIAGHRDMSLTECPGDAAYQLVTDELPVRVAALLAPPPPTASPTPTPTPTRTAAPTPTRTAATPPPVPAPAPTGWLAGAAAALLGLTALGVRAARERGARRP